MSAIGKYNKLEIVKELDFGVYVFEEKLGEILLPKRYVPENVEAGDFIDVFIYLDSKDCLIATTEKPFVTVGEFAYLKVLSVSDFGAFLDWGLSKDLLVPFREQKQKMAEGDHYIVYVYIDEHTQRIVATSKIDKYLKGDISKFTEGEEVDLLVANRTELGYNAIINNSNWGLIYKDEIFTDLRKGYKVKGYIKKLRPDGKIDLTLNKSGYEKVKDITEVILDEIKNRDGFLEITDKSDPELIYRTFEVSKKTFKKAIGSLYKDRLIIIEPAGIRLLEK
ncbi:MAG: hypothetical protein JEY94_07915 [Melioribacteraceae bacterium]|nr:hypothetical protein [Melioribacteraceae bacterium]